MQRDRRHACHVRSTRAKERRSRRVGSRGKGRLKGSENEVCSVRRAVQGTKFNCKEQNNCVTFLQNNGYKQEEKYLTFVVLWCPLNACQKIGKPQQCMYLACSYQSLASQKTLDRIRGVHMHRHVVCIPVEEHTLPIRSTGVSACTH